MESRPWEQFTQDILALYRKPMKQPATRSKLKKIITDFGLLCSTTADFSSVKIADWVVEHKHLRPESVRSYLAALAAAIEIAVEEGWMPKNPFKRRPPATWADWDVEDLPAPVHTIEEVRAVMAKADELAAGGDRRAGRTRTLIYLLAYTGMRAKEALALRVADVDLVEGWIYLRPNSRRKLKTKRKSRGKLPIAPVLARVLRAWLPRCDDEWVLRGTHKKGPWIHGAKHYKPGDYVKKLGLAAGVEGLTMLSFRHTVASLSENWGIGELMLQRLLRHTTPKMQQGYRHPLDGPMQEAVAKIAY